MADRDTPTPSTPATADDAAAGPGELDLAPDGGLETLVDLRVPIHTNRTSTTLPPVVQDPNHVRLERMLARQHEVYGVPTPLVGRRQQLEAVYDAVRASVNSHAWRSIVVRGQPGMGKTRLIAELFSIIDPVRRGMRVLAVSASDTEPSDGLGIVSQLLRQRFEIEASDSDEVGYDKVLTGLGVMVDERLVTTAARLLAYLASLKAAVVSTGERRLDNLMRFHQRAVATLFNLLRHDASAEPHVVVIHRAQHLTPRAIELLTRAMGELETSPITLILLTTGRLPRVLAPRVDECIDLELSPLPRGDMESLARALLVRVKAPPDRLVADLVDRSAGNPGLLEDNFRLLIERGVVVPRAEGPWELVASTPADPVPETVADVSAARVNALSSTLKEILQWAAVVGPTFWNTAVVALSRAHPEAASTGGRDVPWVTDKRRQVIELELDKALKADLIIESPKSSVAGAREYTFATRASCEAFYDGLDPARRQQLHRMAAQWFDTLDNPVGAGAAETARWSEAVAGHLEAGQRPERAAHYLLSAGEAAVSTYDLSRAQELFRRGVALIDVDNAPLLVRLLQGMGDVEQQRGDFSGARRTFGTLLEATVLAGKRGDGAGAWLRLGQVHRARADYARARPCFQNALRLYRSLDDTAGISDALDEIAKVVWLRGGKGSYDEALDFFRRAMEIRRVSGDPRALAFSLSNVANVRLLRGEFGSALKSYGEAIALRRRVGDRSGEAMSHVGLGAVHFAMADYDKAGQHWESGLRLAETVGHRALAGVLLNNLGEARIRAGRSDEAETLLAEAREVADEIGDQRAQADIGRNLAALHGERGEWELALKCAETAVEQARGIEARTTLGMTLVTFGDVLSRAAASGALGSAEHVPQADGAFEQAERLFSDAGDVVGALQLLERFEAHADRHGDDTQAARLRDRRAQIIAGCEPVEATAPVPSTSPRKRTTTRPRQAAAQAPPALPPVPESPSSPAVPEADGAARPPQHTLEFNAAELQRGLVEVPSGLVVPAKKARKKKTSRSKATKRGRGAASSKTTKRDRAAAPPPLPDGD